MSQIRVILVLATCLAFPIDQWTSADPPDVKTPARTDIYGDPLPAGAIARMGSIRFRHAGLSDFVILAEGKTVLTSGSDRVLRFWDLASGRQVRAIRLQGTAGPGRAVTLSPDGKILASNDGALVVLWEVDSGKELKKIPVPNTNVGFLYFSPDGKTLAVGRGDWKISMWDWRAEKEREFPFAFTQRQVVQFNMDSSFHASFSPDGKWFVAGASLNEPLGVFEAATGREFHRLDCHAYTSTVSPDSKRLAAASYLNDKGGRETVIRLYDLTSGKEEKQFPLGREGSYHSLAFSPDGKFLACGFSDDSFMLDLTTGRVTYKLTGRPIWLVFSSDGKTLIASTGHRLRLWDAATGQERDERPGEFGYDPALAVSPDGRWLASGDWMEQVVSLWETTSGRLLRRLPLKGQQRYVRNLAFLADGKTLVASQGMGFLQFWDVATGKEQRTVQLNDAANPNKDSLYFYDLHVSRDGKSVSALDRHGATRLALWDTAACKLVSQQVFAGELRRVAWLADGKTAALVLNDGVALVEVATGLIRFRFPGSSSGGRVASSPDGRLLAQSNQDQAGAVTVWESATGNQVGAISTQNDQGKSRVEHLALAPDNRLVVTTDKEFLHVWDLATGKERRRWPLPEAGTDSWDKTFVFGLTLSPDGKRAFTPLADGTALVWDLSPALDLSEPLVKRAREKDIDGWWADLPSEDARRAYGVIWRLVEGPQDQVVGYLRNRLKPAGDANYKEVRQFIADLDSDKFVDREKASKRLEELGNAAIPAMREALEKQPPPEARRRLETLLSRPQGLVRSSESVRNLRATQVLEQIASKDARQLLAELAKGAAHAPETQEAKASLERLDQRASNKD